MARPEKNNADYFPHVNNMRDDDKIKAVRKKFKHEGYSIYNMLVEYLTGKDHFRIQLTEINLELMAGDFDIKTERLKEMIDYFVKVDLFQINDGVIACETLENRLIGLLSKRKRDKERVSGAITPVNDSFRRDNTHSKVKESKEKKSKVKDSIYREIFGDENFMASMRSTHPGKNYEQAFSECWNHFSELPSPPVEVWQWRQKFNTWLINSKPQTNGVHVKPNPGKI